MGVEGEGAGVKGIGVEGWVLHGGMMDWRRQFVSARVCMDLAWGLSTGCVSGRLVCCRCE